MIPVGFNWDLAAQTALLHYVLKLNEPLYQVLLTAPLLGIKDYYVGAGCVCQSVWNYQCKRPLMEGVSDVDLCYFDGGDLSYEAEDRVIKKAAELFAGCGLELDVKNQARVHLWYKSRFGIDVPPLLSLEDAINTWPTTATSIGVRIENGELTVYAPFGLNDMFGQVVRANKTRVTQQAYAAKCVKWKQKWDTLKIIEW